VIALPFLLLQAGYADPALKPKDREHWAFVEPRRAEPPRARRADLARNPIDAFILARLEAAGVEPLPEADPAALLRRVTFDLTGLPPSPQEIHAFTADAYERVVDRLLASPAYGERWAQHWLDLARFAETDGFEHDKSRPDAWRYRDWVIDALNADVPYDRFLALQLAADQIAPDQIAATGFLVAGPDMPDVNNQDERRHALLNEMTGTVGAVFLGLTLGCAECHDHKYDPLSLGDFYRMRAAFAGILAPQRDKQVGSVVRDLDPQPPAERVFLRGDVRRPGPAVEPAAPRVLGGAPLSGRRRALAEWLGRADHPLTARVAVNWLWAHHFGRGIVATPGDFGRTGAAPTHPELLDWLATELPRLGWSLKAMHRLMVTSSTYRRSSVGPRAAADPDNALWGRAHRRRLEGETIRDAMLSVAGLLNERRGGPGVRPPLPPEVARTLLKDQWEVSPDPEDHRRRSIYLFARRNLRFPLFEAFDRPGAQLSCPERPRSTTPMQSLALMNSALAREASEAFAHRIEAEPDPIDRAFRLALGRPPKPQERDRATAFLKDPAALEDFCLALLNLNEFVFID
jgi:hypothetical protein